MIFKDDRENWDDWKWQISHSCRSLSTLQDWVAQSGPESGLPDLPQENVLDTYQMGITPYYFDLIRKFDPADPIFRQIVPMDEELQILPYELDDPISDDAPATGSRPLKALVHRYPNRVLLFPTALCAVYCRFCFRKRLVGKPAHNAREDDLAAAYAYIKDHPEISEVILTGGDPLTLNDRQLMRILDVLDDIDHLQTIRIHTRIPVVNPFRLTPELGASLKALDTPVWVSAHFNHANELTSTAKHFIGSWIDLGIPFLNQSVLLKGINDDLKSLKELFLALIAARIKPYYLHQADLVKGTRHLRVRISKGQALMQSLRGLIPGYAIPHYMYDQPGGQGKISLDDHLDLNHPDEQ
jgi:lysine 2,3-aminomutase